MIWLIEHTAVKYSACNAFIERIENLEQCMQLMEWNEKHISDYMNTIKKPAYQKTYDFHTDSSNVKTLYFDVIHRAQNNRLCGRLL